MVDIQNTGAVALFEARGWLDEGEYTPEGLSALSELLDPLPTIWGTTPKGNQGRWGPVFISLMSKVVPASIELVIVRENKVLLTHRTDTFFTGWHTPGSYFDPSDTLQSAADRCAEKELGCEVKVERYLNSCLQTKMENKRFADLPNLVLCHPITEPRSGEWFSEMPDTILAHHRKYWPYIEAVLSA